MFGGACAGDENDGGGGCQATEELTCSVVSEGEVGGQEQCAWAEEGGEERAGFAAAAGG